jgi:hypothetical protein
MEKLIACSLSPAGRASRGDRWRALVEETGVEIVEVPQGLELRFGTGAERELRELAELERECCAFADWTVEGTTLVVTGEGDAVPVVQSLFAALR